MRDQSKAKVASFKGAEYAEDNELQDWRAQFLGIFFEECPQAFDEFKGPVYRELVILKARARLAALDDEFRLKQLAEFQVLELRICLAIFTCFQRSSGGKLRHRINASHLALCTADHLPDLIPFREVFLGWLRQYRLNECQWVIEALLDSLGDLDEHPQLFRSGYWADRGRAGFSVESKPFDFKFREFGLTWESRERYQAELELSFKGAMNEHFSQIEHLAKERGLKSAKDKEPAHFKWLIQYVCLNKSFREIGSKGKDRASAEAVRKAIKRLADELGVFIPKGPRGRPRET